MSSVDVLRLFRNRCGVFCFRLCSGARDQRVSLGTKCLLAAHMIASKINAAVSSARAREKGMTGKNPTLAELGIDLASLRKYEIDLRSGAVRTDGTRADHEAAMEAIDRIGMISGGWPKTPPEELAASMAAAAAARAAHVAAGPAQPSRTLAAVAESWIAERRRKNKPRTVYAKECHYGNFAKHLASVTDMAAFNAADLAAFKKREQNAAKERIERAEPYKPFTDSDISQIFEPAAYKAAMSEPDLYWCP